MASNPWAMNKQELPWKRDKIHSVHSCIRPEETRNNILTTPKSKTTQGFKT